jgi:hypothetical protein
VAVHAVGDQAVMFGAVQLFDHQELLDVPEDELDSIGERLKKTEGYFCVFQPHPTILR